MNGIQEVSGSIPLISTRKRSTCRKASASFLFVLLQKGERGIEVGAVQSDSPVDCRDREDNGAQFAPRIDPLISTRKRHLQKQVPLFVISHIRQFCLCLKKRPLKKKMKYESMAAQFRDCTAMLLLFWEILSII